mgnify:CR=1 FL=1
MGNWFENMEPMNIQEERANTKRERERADQAEKTVIDLLKKIVDSKELAIKNLVESYDKTEDEAQKLVEKYW